MVKVGDFVVGEVDKRYVEGVIMYVTANKYGCTLKCKEDGSEYWVWMRTVSHAKTYYLKKYLNDSH